MPSHNKASAAALAAIIDRVKTIRESDCYLTSVPLPNVTFVDGGLSGNYAVFVSSDVALSAAPTAAFEVVAMIARSNCFTSSGGTADVVSKFSDQQDFTKTKIKFNATAPDHPLLSEVTKNDWPKISTVLTDIQKQDEHFDSRNRNNHLTNQVEGIHFTLNHNLFIPKTTVETQSDNEAESASDKDSAHGEDARDPGESDPRQHGDTDHPAENATNSGDESDGESLLCEVKDWPASDDWHRLARKSKADDTHFVCKLPAYDVDGNLMNPTRYDKDLPGATVHLRFSLNNRVVNRDNNVRKILMTAVVQHIRVLLPPTKLQSAPAFITPEKRKLSSAPSSSKKTRRT